MFATLFAFLVASFIFTAFGRGFAFYFDRGNTSRYTLCDAFFVGLTVVGTLLTAWSLLLPCNYIALIVLFAAAAFLAYKTNAFPRSWFREILQKRASLALAAVSLVLTLAYALTEPKLYDSYLYHINSIFFNEHYATIPGLANLHDRYGFNSTAFVLNAAFSFSALYNQSLYIISALSYAAFAWWLLKAAWSRKDIWSLFLLLFLYLFTLQYQNDISSPGSDLVTNILVSYVCISATLYPESLKQRKMVYVALPLFCITLKLTVLPVALLSVVALSFSGGRILRPLYLLAAFAAMFVLPWIIKTTILTGYVLFPMESLDLFSFDWKVPADIVAAQKNDIYAWARIPYRPAAEVLAMPLREWGLVWWEAREPLQKVIFLLAAGAPVLLLIYLAIVRKKVSAGLLAAFAAALGCFLLWAFTAPDFRFSYSAMLFLATAPLFCLLSLLPAGGWERILAYTGIAAAAVVFFTPAQIFFNEAYAGKKLSAYLYLPPDAWELKYRYRIPYRTVLLNTPGNSTISIYTPVKEYGQCYDQFPCTPYLGADVKPRGEDIAQGFKRQP